MNPTVLVVENELTVQELLVLNLRRAGYLAVSANSADEGESTIRAALPDLVVLDRTLPDQSGMTLAKKLRHYEHTQDTPILMLTAPGHNEDSIEGMDYILKPFSPREFLSRVRAVLRRRPYLHARVAVKADAYLSGNDRSEEAQLPISLTEIEVGGLVLTPATCRVTAGEKSAALSPTELRLLFFLMNHSEYAHSRAELRAKVLGKQGSIEDRTVDVYIRRLRAALESLGHHERVETVRGVGYRFRGK